MEKILTVVVPAYNAEPFLRTNLDSLCIPQLLEHLEVLIVNDGSTDGTAQIAEEYCKKHPGTFRLITKENGGHGSGINCGIEHARGQYFKVVDADDWVDRDAFINLVTWLRTCGSDLVYSGFLWAFDRGEASPEQFSRKAEFEKPFSEVIWKKEYLFDEIADRLYIKMHNLTIRTSLLRSMPVRIDEHCYYVDTEYIAYPIPYVKTVSFLPDFVYLYRIGRSGQSMSMEKMRKNERNFNRVLRSLFSYYRRLGKDIPCSAPKKRYLENLFARVAAGKYKILLSEKASHRTKKRLQSFDRFLKKKYPAVYEANRNPAVRLLRKSGFLLYLPASVLTKLVYRQG